MVQPFPAPSLRELSRPTGVTEGVSSDGSSGPTIYPTAIINSEIFERLRSSKYTPSVSHSLDSSLREGAGNGLYHSTCRPETARLRAIFIAPTKLKNRFLLPFIGVHSLSLAFARQLPQRGSRGWAVPFNVSLGNRNVAGDFHRPYGGAAPFIGARKCSKNPRGKPGGWGIISQ